MTLSSSLIQLGALAALITVTLLVTIVPNREVHSLAIRRLDEGDYLCDKAAASEGYSAEYDEERMRRRLINLRRMSKVAGGYEAREGQFPSFVSIRMLTPRLGDFYCSGALVADNLVLTAAHCFDRPSRRTLVAAGIHGPIKWRKRKVRPIEVTKRCVSQYYRTDEYSRTTFDVAVLRLETPIADKELAQLPYEPLDYETQGFALGIGYINDNDFSPRLKVLPVKRVNCSEDDIAPTHICFGSNQPNYLGDTCRGDSGGPIMVKKDGKLVLYGLTSYGDSVCEAGVSGISVNFDVYDYVDHINDLMDRCSEEED